MSTPVRTELRPPGRVAGRPVGVAASAATAGVRAACQNRSGSDGGSQVRRHCSRASADTCYSALIRAQTAVLGSTVRLKVSGLLFFSWPPVSWYQSHLITPSVGLMPTLGVDDRRVNSQSAVTLQPPRVEGEKHDCHTSIVRSSRLGHCGAAVFEQSSRKRFGILKKHN